MELRAGEGIRLRLSEYKAIQPFQAGAPLWQEDLQAFIRDPAVSGLGEFLPQVTQLPPDEVLMSLRGLDGKEVAGISEAAPRGSIPRREIEKLQQELVKFKAIANDPKAEPDKKRAAEALELPDPVSLPEFYRLYGPRWRRRVLVIWGCQPRRGPGAEPTAIIPASEAPRRLSSSPLARASPVRWPGELAAALLLLLLLASLGFWLYGPGTQHDGVDAKGDAKSADPQQAGSTKATGPQQPGSQQPGSTTATGPQQAGSRPLGTTAAGPQQPGSQQPGSTTATGPQQPGSQQPGSQQPGSTTATGPQQPGSQQPGSQQPGSTTATGPQQAGPQQP
jgi:hypothetical protein